MAFSHILNTNVQDFLNNLDSYIHELIPDIKQRAQALQDIPCIVLYGNDDIYLEICARELIKSFYEIETLKTQEHEYDKNFTYTASNYHFEFDYSAYCIAFMKSVLKNQSIDKKKHIFLIKKFQNAKSALKRLLDNYSNSVFIMTCKTLTDQAITSRAYMMRCAFNPTHIKTFLKSHYDIEPTYATQTLISSIAGIAKPQYEVLLDKLLITISKSRNQMDIATNIKEYSYKIYHMCIPLSHICKLIINKYSGHAKIAEIVKICADCEHNMVISTKDLLSYEQLFVHLWNVL